MSQLLLCRVCLATNVTVYNILNSCLQEMYEKLTRLPLHADDGKPSTVCYLCMALLRKTYQLWVQSVTSDRLLTRILAANSEVSRDLIENIDRRGHKLASGLDVRTEHIDVAPECFKSDDEPVPELKEEPTAVTSDADHVSIKEDLSDPEDDLPLVAISQQKNPPKEPVKSKDKEFLKGFKSGYATELILTKEQQLAELLARGASVNYLNAAYKCTACRRGFVDPAAYDNHRRKHRPESGAHACEICSMRYRTVRKLRAHAVTAHERRYRCNSCAHQSHTASQAREHERRHRGHVYVCRLCGHVSRAGTSHLTHVRARHRTPHTCAACGAGFLGRHGLRMHREKAHCGLQPVAEDSPAEERYCAECDIQFASLAAWRRHILTAANHAFSKQDKGVCVICGPACPGGGAHLRGGSRPPRPAPATPAGAPPAGPPTAIPPAETSAFTLTCEQCGSSFANGSKLQSHVKRVHLGLKYNKHVVCEVCGKSCTSNASLKYHQRTHTGEKPYQCSTCPKRFADSNQLRIHTRRHTGERPYRCGHCARAFTQKPALNRHYRTHTGAKPYSCQYCTKSFSQSNSLKLHIRTVHLKMPGKKRQDDKKEVILTVEKDLV